MSRSLIAKDALRPLEQKIDMLNAEQIAGARLIVKDGADMIAATGANKVPKKTGATASQITVRQENQNTWAIVSRTLQGYLMQWGAKGHDIAPKDKKAMRIGNVIIRGPVKHPGVKARRWLTKSFKEISPIVTAQLEALLGGLIRKQT